MFLNRKSRKDTTKPLMNARFKVRFTPSVVFGQRYSELRRIHLLCSPYSPPPTMAA